MRLCLYVITLWANVEFQAAARLGPRGGNRGFTMPSAIEKIGQIALTVADADRSQTFYGEVLGLPLLYRFDTLVFFDLGNLRLMLGQGEDVEPGNACIYLRVGDIDAAHAALGAKGLTFQDGPKLIARMPDHELWMAFFQDPDGHQLALMHEKR
jgi:methylmalonyl-CoA/ethylmalonyl-CoA epimerase